MSTLDTILTNDDVSAWEGFWLDLLREYEQVCAEIAERAAAQAATEEAAA